MKSLSGLVFVSLLCGGVGSAELPDAVHNWAAAPFWTPPTRSEPAEIGRDAAMHGQPLASQALPSAPLPFVAMAPCRLADTRGYGFTGAWGPPALPASTPRDFPIAGRCGIAAGAQAVSFNVTVTAAQGPGMILAYPTGGAQPTVSTVNYSAGQTVANAAIVPLGTGGAATFLAGVSGTDLILDVNGYYAPQGAVTALNTLTGDVTLSPGANVSITPTGNTLTIAAAGGGAPTGAAGGSLSGNYPNPAIASGAVSNAQLAAGAVNSTKLANNTAVRSINGAAQDLVTLQGAGAVSVSTAGSTITVGSPSGSMTLGPSGDTTLIAAGYTEVIPITNQYWTPTTTAAAPSARRYHTAAWTGTRMIVWGGTSDGAAVNTGGQYDPVVNAWTATSTNGPSPRAYHTAVWTGSSLLVWGGGATTGTFLDDGGRYDPVADSWTKITAAGAPVARQRHTALWTGSRMLVYGGVGDGPSCPAEGGQYDPVADSWIGMATAGVPSGRYDHTAIWTGSRMIVWGGRDVVNNVPSSGGQYDPVGNVWTPTSASLVLARFGHTALWTGTRMVVWGGYSFDGGGFMGDGAQYDPVGDAWAPTAMEGAPSARWIHTAVFTGSRMIVWGGNVSGGDARDGGLYDPVANAWMPTVTAGAPSERQSHTAVWTGSRMIVWGGYHGGNSNTGGQWSPVSLYLKN